MWIRLRIFVHSKLFFFNQPAYSFLLKFPLVFFFFLACPVSPLMFGNLHHSLVRVESFTTFYYVFSVLYLNSRFNFYYPKQGTRCPSVTAQTSYTWCVSLKQTCLLQPLLTSCFESSVSGLLSRGQSSNNDGHLFFSSWICSHRHLSTFSLFKGL